MAKDAASHRMPAGLIKNGRGQRLWRDITAKWELTESEYRTLENACYTADRIGRIRRALGDELTTEGKSEDASADGGRSSQMRATVNKRWHDSKWEKAYG